MATSVLAGRVTSGDALAIETALRAHTAVAECVVIPRDEGGQSGLVAYVVASSGETRDLASIARTAAGESTFTGLVLMSALPLNDSGDIDYEVLRSLELVDQDVARAWQHALSGLPDVRDAAVFVRDRAIKRPLLHLSDLLKDGAATGGSTAASPATTEPALTSHASDAAPLVPSLVSGPAPEEDPLRPSTLSAALERAARASQATIRCLTADGEESVQSYADLLLDAQRVRAGLCRLGLERGDKVLLQLQHIKDFIAGFWGSVLGGFVPVPLPVGAAEGNDAAASKLVEALRMFDGGLVLTSADRTAAIASICARGGLPAPRIGSLGDLYGEPDSSPGLGDPQDLALIMLTSGSTGTPKGVMLSHANLLSMASGNRQAFGFSGDEVTLNWMPMDHVAGLVYFHLRDVSLGCSQIHVPTERVLQRPPLWLDLLERFRVTVTFAPNFAYGLVNECAPEVERIARDLSSVRIILNGGEAVVARTARRFLSLLGPHRLSPSAICPAWGMSETSSGVVHSRSFSVESTSDDDQFVAVGQPIPGEVIRIVDDAGRIVEQGTIGHLQISGPTVTRGYYQRPDLDAESFTADGWFKTGDLAIVRENQLAITGRVKDDINVNGVKYFSHDIEGVVEQVPGVAVSFTAACAIRRSGADSEELGVFFVPVSDATPLVGLIADVRRAVSGRIGISPGCVLPVTREDIPKTGLGKIQRAQLRKRFESGAFADLVKRIDLLSANANTLPDWFFRPTWRRRKVSPLPVPRPGVSVVFGDEGSASRAFATALGLERKVVLIAAGDSFEKRSVDRYTLAPGDAAGYEQLAQSLLSDGVRIDSIAHLWGLSSEGNTRERDRYLYSVLYAARAFAAACGAEKIRLLVAATASAQVRSGDAVTADRAAVPALVKTIAQEFPSLDATHVDIDDARQAVGCLRNELTAPGTDVEVAYRDRERFVSRIERVPIADYGTRSNPFKRGGTYLLTGGLGGVGLEIGLFLLRRCAARLLVVGRTASPVSGASDDRRRHFELLQAAAERSGGCFRYEAVDAADANLLLSTVESVTGEWQCELDGVIHLAGVFEDRLLAEESRDTFDRILRPKLEGTLAAARLVEGKAGRLFLGFSSATSFFGRIGGGAYSAANAVLDSASRTLNGQGVRAQSLAWSAWDDVGINRGYQSASASGRGYAPMSRAQAVNSMLAALGLEEPVVLIGLEPGAAHVRAHVSGECHAVHGLGAYVIADREITEAGNLFVRDSLGHAVSCEVERVEQIFRVPSGEVDHARMISKTRSSAPPEAPRTELERTIARIWEDVLHVGSVSTTATFFDVGGTSLLMAKVYAGLKSTLERCDLTMTDMFRHPTIAQLAARLGGESASTLEAQIAQDRDRGRDRRNRLLQTRRGRGER